MLLSSENIFLACVAILFLALSTDSSGQLKLYPAYSPGTDADGLTRSGAAARTKADGTVTPLSLPFFDDFSKPVNVIYPDTARWENSASVWVNDGMAIHPPTINVATFDGLNARGIPYNPNEVLLTGYTDTLTSRPIDLSEASLPVDERPGVFLSFFYQWKGNLEPPDEKDHLELSFKAAGDGGWETVMTIYPKEDVDPTVFYDTIIQIAGDQFYHDAFQFRLRTFGRLSGPFDTWHVDYVYLNKGRSLTDMSFPDRALSTRLGPLFGKFRSIPRRHLFSNDQLTPPSFEVQNMKNALVSVNFRTEGLFSSVNRKTEVAYPIYETVISDATPINIDDNNNQLFANEHRSSRLGLLPDVNDPLQFPQDPGIDSTLIRLTIALQTRDNIPVDQLGDYTENYIPIQFTTNDTLTSDYVLADYFAYDDGVAEYAAGLIEVGNRVAYEFELDTTYALKQDTLIGIDVYFPPYAITSNQTVDFFIYHEDPDNPGFPGEQWLRIAGRRVDRKGLNQFQRIQFLPALLIDEKKFYIGWQQPTVGRVLVGLDMSNDTGDKIFVNTNGFWYQNVDVIGSLMLRPVFGKGVIDASVGIEPENTSGVYPNPSNGTFFIDGDITDLRIYSLTGHEIPFRVISHEHRSEISVQTSAGGLYILRYKQGHAVTSRKIIIRQE